LQKMMPLPRIVFSLTRKSISHKKHCAFRQLSSLNTIENVSAAKQKKKKIVRNVVGSLEPQNIHTAIVKMREAAWAKFDETVEVAVNLGVDPRKPNQSVKVIAPLT
jgi:ribosomal protein L1